MPTEEQLQIYYKAVKEKRRAQKRKWIQQNPEKMKELTDSYRKKHREEWNARMREYYKTHAETHKKRVRRWQEKNREKVRQYQRDWRKRNPEKARAKDNASYLRRKQRERLRRKND